MSDQTLDMRRSLQVVRRHKRIVGIVAAVGLLGGAVYTALNPPTLTSAALVVLAPNHSVATQEFIATSDPVLSAAVNSLGGSVTKQKLRSELHVTNPGTNIISIAAKGPTAGQAENTANTVARSYIDYAGQPSAPGGQVQATVLQNASNATGTSLPIYLTITGALGALIGALIGAIVALAVGRRDRRLYKRDEIADSIGLPVLTSIPVGHPSGAGGWTKFLADYEPEVVHAWRMRKVLYDLGLIDMVDVGHPDDKGPVQHTVGGDAVNGNGAVATSDIPAQGHPVKSGKAGNSSLRVLSLSSDPGSLAVGPQFAVFAASLGISTRMVIGPQQQTSVTAALRAACAAAPSTKRSGPLRFSVSGEDDDTTGAALTVVVAVADASAPRVVDSMRTDVTVLAVSSGAVSAEQLALVAVSAADDGCRLSGIFVADPNRTIAPRAGFRRSPGQRSAPCRRA